jgi:protein-tyrosine phosphatase
MDTPGDIERFKKLVKKVVDDYLKKGKKVMIHCQGGNGRTGLFVATCFIYQGYPAEKAIEKTRDVRKYAI